MSLCLYNVSSTLNIIDLKQGAWFIDLLGNELPGVWFFDIVWIKVGVSLGSGILDIPRLGAFDIGDVERLSDKSKFLGFVGQGAEIHRLCGNVILFHYQL